MRPRAMAAELLVILMVILTAGCASSGAGSTAGGGPAGGSGGGGTATAGPPRLVAIGLAANGRTMIVHPYDSIRVRLASTYWRFRPISDGVLSRGKFVLLPMHGHIVAGSGAGAAVATFQARKAGTTKITAARQSCGEAMRCVGGEGSFSVTVVVR